MANSFTAAINELRISVLRFKTLVRVPGKLVVFATMFFAVVMETVMDLLPTLTMRAMMLLALGILVIYYFSKWEIPFRRDAATFGHVDDGKLASRKGVVILVGLDSANADNPVIKLLKRVPHLERIALVGTPEVQERGIFDTIVQEFLPATGHNLEASRIKIWHGGNADSVAASHEATEQALTWLLSEGYGPQELVVDITLGRRSMMLGADRAAVTLSVETQYLGQRWDHTANRPIPNSEAFKVVSEYY